jgi:hypothetical protein
MDLFSRQAASGQGLPGTGQAAHGKDPAKSSRPWLSIVMILALNSLSDNGSLSDLALALCPYLALTCIEIKATKEKTCKPG